MISMRSSVVSGPARVSHSKVVPTPLFLREVMRIATASSIHRTCDSMSSIACHTVRGDALITVLTRIFAIGSCYEQTARGRSAPRRRSVATSTMPIPGGVHLERGRGGRQRDVESRSHRAGNTAARGRRGSRRRRAGELERHGPTRSRAESRRCRLGTADDDAAGADPDVLVAFPSAKQMALVLTGGRLLAWALGISGKPKQYLGEVPLSAVAQVEAGRVRFGSLIRVTLKSGAVVDLEALRGEPGEEFGEQLAYLTAPG